MPMPMMYAYGMDYSNMFYPPLTLSRKDKLSIIWLASFYDPDKHSKKISIRMCEKADIIDACEAIKNPKVRFALRLSAQLMLGTVRIYRIQTRLALKMAERVWLKLRTILSSVNANVIDMPIPIMRSESITMTDTHMSIIDYSLEPVYYDPKMIMHMNESDFFDVNASPIKPSPVKLAPHTPKKSIVTVSNSSISFQEDLLSPTRPIQIPPSENDFGLLGFGPADSKFLEDLNIIDVVDNCIVPRTLVFETEEEVTQVPLETIVECDESVADKKSNAKLVKDGAELHSDLPKSVEDDNMLAKPLTEDAASPKPKPIADAIIDSKAEEEEAVRETDRLETQVYVPEDIAPTVGITSRKRKAGDVFDIDETSQGSSTRLGEPVNLDTLLEEATSLTLAGRTNFDAEETAEQTAGPFIDFTVEACQGKTYQSAVDDEQLDWAVHMKTPADLVLESVPTNEKKRLKIQIDKEIKIADKLMKRNFKTEDTLIGFPVMAGSALPSGRDMFQNPIYTVNSDRVKAWGKRNLQPWEPLDDELLQQLMAEGMDYSDEDNLVHQQELPTLEPLEDNFHQQQELPLPEPMDVVEDPLQKLDEMEIEEMGKTPMESEIKDQIGETPVNDPLRAGSKNIKSFELSAGSSITPGNDLNTRSFDKTLNMDDEVLIGVGESPRISGIADIQLPNEPVFLEDELEPVMEIDEKSVGFIPEMDSSGALLDTYKPFSRKIFNSLETSENTVFQRLFPTSRTKRRDATLAFYLTLNMHRNGFIELHQSELFGDIEIKRGRRE